MSNLTYTYSPDFTQLAPLTRPDFKSLDDFFAMDDGLWLVTTETNADNKPNKLWRSPDWGTTWEEVVVTGAPPDYDYFDADTPAVQHGDWLIVNRSKADGSDTALMASDDGGATWSVAATTMKLVGQVQGELADGRMWFFTQNVPGGPKGVAFWSPSGGFNFQPFPGWDDQYLRHFQLRAVAGELFLRVNSGPAVPDLMFRTERIYNIEPVGFSFNLELTQQAHPDAGAATQNAGSLTEYEGQIQFVKEVRPQGWWVSTFVRYIRDAGGTWTGPEWLTFIDPPVPLESADDEAYAVGAAGAQTSFFGTFGFQHIYLQDGLDIKTVDRTLSEDWPNRAYAQFSYGRTHVAIQIDLNDGPPLFGTVAYPLETPVTITMAESSAIAEDHVWAEGFPVPGGEALAVGEPHDDHSIRSMSIAVAAKATDQYKAGVIVPSPDVWGVAGDALLPGPAGAWISSSAVATDQLLPRSIGREFISVSAVAEDDVFGFGAVMAESSAVASDALLAGGWAMPSVSAIATGEVFGGASVGALIAESYAIAADEAWAFVRAYEFVDSVAWASDQLLTTEPQAVAMAMNMETGAPYLYDNFPMMGAAQAGESVFAIGPDGIYRLEGADDEGFGIDARIELPGLALGKPDGRGGLSRSPERKRVESFWFDCESDSPMSVDVRSYDQDISYRYDAIRTPNDSGNAKVYVGKGMKSKWWGLSIRNSQGGDFELLGASADVLQTNRRR